MTTPFEFRTNINNDTLIVRGKDLDELLANLATATAARASLIAATQGGPARLVPNPAVTQAAPDATASVVPSNEWCQHGKRTRKDLTAPDGKPYVGFFCPEKNPACKPVWSK